ncbi:Phox homologous domain [Phytophthora cinnamomi]|uniref:Phox homologous domain n=1 Tax=Phytophthora cinnamomi TaxID=4785 RepID=UPI00355A696D|nr:Phox homologous domain [Phytophthora cinnamomi]
MNPADGYYEFDIPIIASDSDTERTSGTSSLLNQDGHLSQLSRAKMAIALNSIHQVRMSKTYDREEHVTVYALDVFVHSTPTGITKGNKNIKDEMDNGCSAYQVAHRYSSFRMLRQRIGDVVKVSKDKSHSRWCPYCSRVRDIAKSSVFPSRFPTVGIASGLREYVVHSREKRLEMFVNLLLRGAKDISYRSGCSPCGRFEAVSKLLNDFLGRTTPCALLVS